MKDVEFNLWRRYHEGDQSVIEELMKYHMKLARFWVNTVAGIAPWADREDLTQEALLGLGKAILKFDLDRGTEFSTYARHYIREALYDYLQDSRDLTRSQYENFKKVEKAQEILRQRLGHKPTVKEVAEEAGLTVRQVETAIDAIGLAFPEGLIDPDSDSPLGRGAVDSPDNCILVGELLSRLDIRQRKIITEYYYLGRTDP